MTATTSSMCRHQPTCPPAVGPDRELAQTVATHPEQGWKLLCNGLVVFDDCGELLPDGQIIAAHRPTDAPPLQNSDGGVAHALPHLLPGMRELIGGTPRFGKTSAAATAARREGTDFPGGRPSA